MKLFGWKSGREGSRPALSRAGSITTIGAWPQGYEAQVREGYLGNAVLQRAVKLVGAAAGDARRLRAFRYGSPSCSAASASPAR